MILKKKMKINNFINKYKLEIDEYLVKLLVSSFFDDNINYDYDLTKEELEEAIKEFEGAL